MFFDNWSDIGRVLLVGMLAYTGLVLLLRATGNRTLSKMNSFDFVITVAFGSTLASILISKDVSLAEGLVAIALLAILQFVITWLAVRSRTVSKIIKTQPTLVLRDGKFIPKAMKAVRITEDEIRGAARQHGIASLEQVAAVVMETNGRLSVIRRSEGVAFSALKGVAGYDEGG
jgi:uncharacterized membrane protein YcaP (DUF421 family)